MAGLEFFRTRWSPWPLLWQSMEQKNKSFLTTNNQSLLLVQSEQSTYAGILPSVNPQTTPNLSWNPWSLMEEFWLPHHVRSQPDSNCSHVEGNISIWFSRTCLHRSFKVTLVSLRRSLVLETLPGVNGCWSHSANSLIPLGGHLAEIPF